MAAWTGSLLLFLGVAVMIVAAVMMVVQAVRLVWRGHGGLLLSSARMLDMARQPPEARPLVLSIFRWFGVFAAGGLLLPLGSLLGGS